MISTIFKVFQAVFSPKPLNENEPPVPAPLEDQLARNLAERKRILRAIEERDARMAAVKMGSSR